ncbi:MAG TPA: hypothetical protein PKD91_14815, partial [Bacteroidia bacterium]|nr:hypothetical protein [Bacteroidia bacterium]
MKRIFFAIFICLSSNNTYSQSATEFAYHINTTFPDSIKAGKETGKSISSLEGINDQIIDTLYNPDGYLLKILSAKRDVELYFAAKSGNTFMVYPMGNWAAGSEFKISRIDFNGKGTKELLMINHQEKKQSENSSADYCEEWLSIWNLDSVEMLALFQNYSSSRLTESNSNVISDCYNFIPTIRKNEISFEQSAKCNLCGENLAANVVSPFKVQYKLTSGGLLKYIQSGGIYHISKNGNLVPNVSGKYKLYKDKMERFSFKIPKEWNIIQDSGGELDDMAIPAVPDSIYIDFMENGFFKIETYSPGLCDSAFMENEGFTKVDSVYYTFGKEYNISNSLEDAYRAI